MATKSHDPELALYDLEVDALEVARLAMEAYAETEGVPPTNVLKAIQTAHTMILRRLEKKIGFNFDVNDLEGALLAVEKQRELILQLRARREQQKLTLS